MLFRRRSYEAGGGLAGSALVVGYVVGPGTIASTLLSMGARVVRMHEAPRVETHIVRSTAHPTGMGEPGTPPIAPAVANAMLALTGKATNRLPFVTS